MAICSECYDAPAVCNAGHCEKDCTCGAKSLFANESGERCVTCAEVTETLCEEGDCPNHCTCEVE
jgi:hypothetical protein